MSATILAISTVLQYIAAALALRLVVITKHRTAWILIASAILLMAVRRSITLYRLASGDLTLRPDPTAESVALVISILMLAGVSRIASLFIDLKHSAAEISKSQRQLQAILDHTPAAVYVKGADGQYLLCNGPLLRALDRRSEEVLGKTDHELLPPDVANDVSRNDALVLQQGSHLECDETVPHADGTVHHYLSIKFPLTDTTGQTYAVCGISTDITDRLKEDDERRLFDAKLQHSQKLESLGVLAGGIAHDFNNLLVVIQSGIELAQSHDDAPQEVSQDLESAFRASKAAAALCQQLLAYTGKEQLHVAPIDLSGLVDDMAKMMAVSISKKARLNTSLAERLPLISADASQLQQVVMNLITNASDALEGDSGTIAISTSVVDLGPEGLDCQRTGAHLAPGRYVCIEVHDSGAGMSAETRDRLFEPFYTTKFTGRGLGLAAVAGVVRSHGGGISVQSKVHAGTTFRVLLPVSARQDRPRSAPAEPAIIRPAQGTILVVDDEPGVREMTQRVLQRAGFDAVAASDGRRAVEVFAQNSERFELVLLDLTMPEMDGEQAFKELKRISPTVRVLLTSGFDASATTRSGFAQGLAGFLKKPYTARQLIAAVQAALT